MGTNNEVIKIVLIIVLVCILFYAVAYGLGRIFAKGFLHETDNFLYNKVKQFKSKKVENGTENKKENEQL